MNSKHGWLIVLVVVALLVAACGPEMTTPTPSEKAASPDSITAESREQELAATEEKEPTATEAKAEVEEPATPAELPVDADDWHVLGSPEAPVTIVEYADFQ